jgi:type IV secretory pathway VirB4 component
MLFFFYLYFIFFLLYLKKIYINSDFDKRIFNTPGKLFPESDITQLDVGVFGSDGYESKLVVAFASLVNDINRIAEKNQFSGRPIFLLIDEAHLFTKHPLIISWILKMVKMWRKWGVWVWFATPSLKDYTDAASSMFDTIEWIICLKIKKSEAAELAKLINMTDEQKELIASINGARQYKEGVVISDQLSTLFRSVSMPLALALAMTEQSEKAIRQEIMQKNTQSFAYFCFKAPATVN